MAAALGGRIILNGVRTQFEEKRKIFANLIVPEEISKRTLPLGYAFADFSRKRKVSASVGGMSPQNQKFDAALFRGRSERFDILLRTEDSANLPNKQRGSVTACGYCGGYFPPRRYPRGHFLLDTSLHPFFVKRKDVPVWAA
ncbi:hypothetical protein [Negativibacillus massiliensis]|uniref:hypothetical protein n=1 Tax=Negativibacillus massiliensis TaxID=1871035 RepID=UPI0009756F3C|nr:hypothetical protein [Negativibacillus massiliensis]